MVGRGNGLYTGGEEKQPRENNSLKGRNVTWKAKEEQTGRNGCFRWTG